VSDVETPFVPLPPESLFLNVGEHRESIDAFLDKLFILHETPKHKNPLP